MIEKPYTPATLAERWGCSPDAVYDLIRSGRLPAFRVGSKLLRIQAKDVAAWESGGANTQSGNTGLGTLTDKPSPVGKTKRGLTVEGLASVFPK
ncbi:MAG: helix-turn-helix domain-containing protein [Betaproteobacteria bacterium]